jgi:hypothetical protein
LIKGKDPEEDLYEIEEDEEEILPEPTIDNLTFIARELNKV